MNDALKFALFAVRPLAALLDDDQIIEIMVNGKDSVFVERLGGRPELSEVRLTKEQLVHDHFIDAATWRALAAVWNEQQLMDLVFAVGQYTLVSMALNSFGVQLEDTTERFPADEFVDGLFPRTR